MPTYDFMCEKCSKPFTVLVSLAEYEKGRFRCPGCKSTRVRQQITPFTVNTSKKS
jgi:putative FmdB family regulatory protein